MRVPCVLGRCMGALRAVGRDSQCCKRRSCLARCHVCNFACFGTSSASWLPWFWSDLAVSRTVWAPRFGPDIEPGDEHSCAGLRVPSWASRPSSATGTCENHAQLHASSLYSCACPHRRTFTADVKTPLSCSLKLRVSGSYSIGGQWLSSH